MSKNIRYLVPLIIFIVVAAFLYRGLSLNPREVPSPFINKPAPDFTLQKLENMGEQFSNKDMLGKVWLLNVWASWCVACRQEHPLLVQMRRRGEIPIYGLNYKDAPSQARQWLKQHGDPYEISVVDFQGNVGIDYGVYGVPETFIIDKRGIIRHKVIGPISTNILNECVMPLVKVLEQEDPQVTPTEYQRVEGCA
ncbi:MAG: DsbE family thiol:disulfide interchange protein [Gammaproteobacteria bacterium]|jgi:cytochrome c biogenesis protein CcmG/thiol:disulfide interchange protein DsbE|nr:DsbE family thiol:disulfide interchange protein [Gammaproteobacteria bacterium]